MWALLLQQRPVEPAAGWRRGASELPDLNCAIANATKLATHRVRYCGVPRGRDRVQQIGLRMPPTPSGPQKAKMEDTASQGRSVDLLATVVDLSQVLPPSGAGASLGGRMMVA